MSNQLKNVCLCYQLLSNCTYCKTIPLIEEEKLIPLTQCSLLVEHNLISSCRNSKNIDANLIFIVECTGDKNGERSSGLYYIFKLCKF